MAPGPHAHLPQIMPYACWLCEVPSPCELRRAPPPHLSITGAVSQTAVGKQVLALGALLAVAVSDLAILCLPVIGVGAARNRRGAMACRGDVAAAPIVVCTVCFRH